MPPRSQYGVLQYFTVKIYEAFQRIGIESRLLEAEKNNPKPFLDKLFENPPDFTFSLNGLLPDEEGRFFCDMVKIPHIGLIVDSAHRFISLLKSEHTVIACVDKSSVDFFDGLKAKHSVFIPHGVERDITPFQLEDKKYDVTLLASCIDYETIRNSWHQKFTPKVCTVLDKAAEISLGDQETPFVEALVQAIDQFVSKNGPLELKELDFISLLDELEMFIKGKDRIALVRAIEDSEVHVFGSYNQTAQWKKYLADMPNVTIHDPVPYEQANEVMSQSKILLNSCPFIKFGGHERIFAGLCHGALVLTSENPFLRQTFKDGENILFYHHHELENVNDKIKEYLNDDSKRKEAVLAGRDTVMQNHTWDHRAEEIIKDLEPIHEEMKYKKMGIPT